jgi:beta-glucosidase
VQLNPGETKEVVVEVDPEYLSIFNAEKDAWHLTPGSYSFLAGGSSQSLPLKMSVDMK